MDNLKHEFSALDENGRVVYSGKRFESMLGATNALKKLYLNGISSGWQIRDDTLEKEAYYVDVIHKCNPSLKKSFINVNGSKISVSSVDHYVVVPFSYKGKEYAYREHLGEGWIDSMDEILKAYNSIHPPLSEKIKDAQKVCSNEKIVKHNTEHIL